MIGGLDSSFDAPSAAQADQARVAGVGLWNGYLATRPGVGLAAPWTELAFANARRCGGTPIAFCSGWDDPVAVRAQAAAWNVRACLDDEPGIRGDGYDRQAWCDAAGAGIYGLRAVHGVRAAFHVIARYPGFDPGASWDGTRPADGAPCGWQWQGTHTEFGRSVDRGWYDDWFGGDTVASFPARDQAQAFVDEMYQADGHRVAESDAAREAWVSYALIHGLQATVEAMAASPEFATNNADLLRLLGDYRAGRLGGSVLPPHHHGGGSTGPAVADPA